MRYTKYKKVIGRCHGKTADGKACKRMVQRSPYCYQHLIKNKGIQIKKSHINRGGVGVYNASGKPIKAGHKIVEYGGVLTETPIPFGGDYVLQLTKTKFLDGNRSNKGLGSFANRCQAKDIRAGTCAGNNVHFKPTRDFKQAWLVSTKAIKKDGELFASYGNNYGG